jgi:serine/threonine protein kinase/tetratricopeptide (TPR) repeat protein
MVHRKGMVAPRVGAERSVMKPERWRQVKDVLDKAMALNVPTRTAYLDEACAGDAELRSEVESLLGSHGRAGERFMQASAATLLDFDSGEAGEMPRIGRRIGVYQIVSEIAQGGMGAVYRAVRADGQYEKQVAIKLVRVGFDTAFMLERFRHERQILATLDHPNIARLLDGGTTDEGQPYLVMELIEGTPIDDYCDAHKLNITQRLRLFRQVCTAVEYAHQRLVIHRDIKPSNILVTEQGTPKLLDFGIAKILDPADTAETTLGRPMTPAYASPEQLRGEPITTATDVYSLGVVLYQLLTGRSPYAADSKVPHELARNICDVPPTRPSTAVTRPVEPRKDTGGTNLTPATISSVREGSPARLRRRVAGDLDNIVLKALHKEPARRYASVEQFDEDLRRHLQGLPVAARKDSWSYRGSKFVGRHKAGVVVAGLASIALAVGIGLIVRAERTARKQAEIARAERTRAEQRFNDLRKLSNSLIFEIHDSIQNLPGSTPARKLLLDRAVEYLDSLAKDSGGDPELQRDLAWGYQRLAVVQGNATESNLGDPKAYEASNHKATALFESVAKANPDNLTDQLNVAMMHRIQSFSETTEPSGQKDLDQALAITERLMKTDGNNPKVKAERSIEYQNLSMIQDAAGDRVHALESMQKYQAMRVELYNFDPKHHGIKRTVAMSTVQLGVQLAVMGSRREALEQIQAGIQNYEEIAKSEPNPDIKRELAVSLVRLGHVQLMQGDTRGAIASFREARAMIEPLTKDDPENAMLRSDLVGMDYEDGRTLVIMGKYEEAVSRLRTTLQAVERSRSTEDLSLGDVYIWLGEAQAGMHDLSGSLDSYKKAAAALEIPAGETAYDDTRCESAVSYTKMADVLLKKGDRQQARTAYQKALDIVTPSISLERHDVPAFYAAADAYAGLADVSAAEAREARDANARSRLWNEARSGYEKSRAMWEKIPNPSHIGPTGFEARDSHDVARRINECNRELAHFAPALPSEKT